jgi:hypothetical protein
MPVPSSVRARTARRAATSDALATPFGRRVPIPAPVPVVFSDLSGSSGSACGLPQQLCTPWQGAELRIEPVRPVSFSALATPGVPALPAPRLGSE